MKICVIIPIYNESEKIGTIVEALKRKNLDVVVVDDGSTDNGGVLAKENGAVVISHPHKSGKGVSLRDGFNYITSKDYDGAIAMDGDGQHDIEDITQFINKAKEDKNSVITGNRMDGHKGMPLIRVAVNRIMSFMISWLCGQKVPDSQCGYRYIATEVLRNISLSSSEFEIESEVLIQASRKGFKIYSIAIKTIYSDERSKIQPVKDTVRFINYFLREVWNLQR